MAPLVGCPEADEKIDPVPAPVAWTRLNGRGPFMSSLAPWAARPVRRRLLDVRPGEMGDEGSRRFLGLGGAPGPGRWAVASALWRDVFPVPRYLLRVADPGGGSHPGFLHARLSLSARPRPAVVRPRRGKLGVGQVYRLPDGLPP